LVEERERAEGVREERKRAGVVEGVTKHTPQCRGASH
jgi:hypothetical protein